MPTGVLFGHAVLKPNQSNVIRDFCPEPNLNILHAVSRFSVWADNVSPDNMFTAVISQLRRKTQVWRKQTNSNLTCRQLWNIV